MFEPVDVAALATFRIMFGLLMLWEVWRYFDKGRITRYYMDPEFLFKYYGFEWLHPWPGNGMLVHFWALGVLALLVTLGWCYRVAMALFFLGFTYVFLLDQAQYLNHFYLVSLVAFLMCFLPAARGWSLDAWFHHRSDLWVPRWTHWLLLLQFEVMYIFAGLVKVNGDWLRLEPLRTWLQARSDQVWFGAWFQHDWVIAAGAYGSVLLHLVGAPLLLWRPARPYVFTLYVLFHLSNHALFSIGIFPWLAIVGTLLFFGPTWPRDFLRRLMRGWGPLRQKLPLHRPSPPLLAPPRPAVQIAVLTLVAGWTMLQVVVPLPHYLYPGNVSWHEQGHRFAWQMKLRQTHGSARFIITDPRSGESWTVDPTERLSPKQARYMAARPDMLLQYAHHLGRQWRDEYDVPEPEVRVEGWKSLNGREPEPLVDPDRDLMKVPRSLRNADWILPMAAPLPPRVNAGAEEDEED